MPSTTELETNIDRVCQEDENYTEEENRQRIALRFLLKYLELHDDYLFRRSMAKIHRGGLFGIRVYMFTLQYAKSVRITKLEEQTYMPFPICPPWMDERTYRSPPILPPWPVLSSELDADVTSHIVSFLDDKSLGEASRVCWSFYHALAPRQRRVTLNGCQSYPEIALWNFTGVESFSARVNGHIMTEKFLYFLNSTCLCPRLQHVDFSGCERLSTYGLKQFVGNMGARLESFACRFSRDDGCVQGLSKALATESSSLENLSLTLNRKWSALFDFSLFEDHQSLKGLSVTVDGYLVLPKRLPLLEVLKLEFIDENPRYFWRQLVDSHYPNLKQLEITISNYALPTMSLGIDVLISALSTMPNLESLTFRRRHRESPLDGKDDRINRTLPEAINQRLNGLQHDPHEEADELKRLATFTSRKRIVGTVEIAGGQS